VSPSSSLHGNSGALAPGDGSTDVPSARNHTLQSTSTRRRIGAASAAVALLAATGLLLDQSGAAQAAPAPGLGRADGFAVLAASTITNTGPTTITGDIGIDSVDATFGGETEIVLNGSRRSGAVSNGAGIDLDAAYTKAAQQTPFQTVGTELGGTQRKPGVYRSPTFGVTGTLTLDAQGDPDAVFIFQAGSTLITASDSSVVLINGAQACNVFWQVGSSATLGTRTDFIGTILAQASVTLNNEAGVQGRVLASTGAVTMDENTITRATCATPDDGDGDGAGGGGGDGAGDGGTDGGTDGDRGNGGNGGNRGTSGGPGGTQVPRVPVGSVDAGDGSLLGSRPDTWQ
jgi:hypothetical protein